MRIIFLTALLFPIFLDTFSRNIIASPDYEGSALCGDLQYNFHMPKDTQGKYRYEETITKSDTGNYILINYYLRNSDVDTLKYIQSNINKYFNEVDYRQPENLSWKIKTSVYIEEDQVYSKVVHLSPFTNCFKLKPGCNQLTIFRNFLIKDCQGYEYQSNLSASIHLDSILIYYNFSEEVFTNTCEEEKPNRIRKTDSLVLTNVKPGGYRSYLGTIFRVCNNAPCPPEFTYTPFGDSTIIKDCILPVFQESRSEEVKIYPNPAKRYIYIKDLKSEVIFTNQIGQRFIIPGNGMFNISKLVRGLYIVRYERNGKIERSKVVIR